MKRYASEILSCWSPEKPRWMVNSMVRVKHVKFERLQPCCMYIATMYKEFVERDLNSITSTSTVFSWFRLHSRAFIERKVSVAKFIVASPRSILLLFYIFRNQSVLRPSLGRSLPDHAHFLERLIEMGFLLRFPLLVMKFVCCDLAIEPQKPSFLCVL